MDQKTVTSTNWIVKAIISVAVSAGLVVAAFLLHLHPVAILALAIALAVSLTFFGIRHVLKDEEEGNYLVSIFIPMTYYFALPVIVSIPLQKFMSEEDRTIISGWWVNEPHSIFSEWWIFVFSWGTYFFWWGVCAVKDRLAERSEETEESTPHLREA